MCTDALMVALDKSPDWATAKKEMADTGFINKLAYYDSKNLS